MAKGEAMKKLIALFLVITFMGMNCAPYKRGEGLYLEPGQKPGAKLRILKKDGQHIEGELIAVKKNSLLLKKHESGVDVSVGIIDIGVIEIVRDSKSGRGAIYGGLIGALVGAIVFGAIRAQDSETGEISETVLVALIGGALASGPGALLGAITGPALIPNKKINFEGQTERQIQWILDELRKEARVPDFQ